MVVYRDAVTRVGVSRRAVDLLRYLRRLHGPVMFFESESGEYGAVLQCCPRKEALPSERTVFLGMIDDDPDQPTPVWVHDSRLSAWRRAELIIDVVPGDLVDYVGFSLEAAADLRFVARRAVIATQ
jgi:uncharacterized protein